MADVLKRYDDMDDKVLSQTGTKKSNCKSCKKGEQEVLITHVEISARLRISCDLTDRQSSEDPEVKLGAREEIQEARELLNKFETNYLSLANFKKFLAMTTGHDREELEAMPMKDLKALAKAHGIKGRSREDLVNSLVRK